MTYGMDGQTLLRPTTEVGKELPSQDVRPHVTGSTSKIAKEFLCRNDKFLAPQRRCCSAKKTLHHTLISFPQAEILHVKMPRTKKPGEA